MVLVQSLDGYPRADERYDHYHHKDLTVVCSRLSPLTNPPLGVLSEREHPQRVRMKGRGVVSQREGRRGRWVGVVGTSRSNGRDWEGRGRRGGPDDDGGEPPGVGLESPGGRVWCPTPSEPTVPLQVHGSYFFPDDPSPCQ